MAEFGAILPGRVFNIGTRAILWKDRNSNLGGDAKHSLVQQERMLGEILQCLLNESRHVTLVLYIRKDKGKMIRIDSRQRTLGVGSSSLMHLWFSAGIACR
jgi:hypothetical protein